ncbi:hypothetical protein LTR17_010500 [Elasticomyces elasticus]|nr:hypothetical protein LTR17_010500 [Elasticomyces elasticus]
MPQNALVVNELGGPLALVERPTPSPLAGEVLVRIEAAGLNPHDQKGRDNGLFVNLPGAILANDIAGLVESVGSNVTKFNKGDRIFGQSSLLGRGPDAAGLQQYCVLEADVSAHIPPSISFEEAATIPVNAIASFVAIFHSTGLGVGFPRVVKESLDKQNIVIVGGGTSTGKFAIQFAKLAGFGGIIALASSASEDELRELGATHVVDRHAPDVGARVETLVGDDLIYVVDMVSRGDNQSFPVSLLSNTQKGEYASLVPGKVTEKMAKLKKAGFERKGVLGLSHKHRDICVPFWDNICDWIVDGTVKVQRYAVVDGLDAEKVNALLDCYRDGVPTTKTLIRPNKVFSVSDGT